jgi:hypothetical protein
MTLAEAADGRIAGHRPDRRKSMGQQHGSRAIRAAAAAASQPAWPPPITMTSKVSMTRPRIAVLLTEPIVVVKMVFHVNLGIGRFT